LLGGINDRPEDARLLAEYLRQLKAIVNLLPWNPVPDLPYRRPTAGSLKTFQAVLQDRGIPVTQRYRRGGNVSAACGQLCIRHDGADSSHTGG
jgi:23S rRNA (adenine2503-C2)-methyltransferase